MKRSSLLLCAAVVALSSCASVPAPQTSVTAPAVSHPAAPVAANEVAEYRKALEDAYAQIVAREVKPVNPPQVDVEAAASIPIPEHRTINGAVKYFSTDLRDSIQASLTRSGRYRKLIDEALEEYGLPKGLAYLPVIESAYIPTLTSRAGAHGIWQFMPATARDYGLRVDWWVDERADPERSTRAAAAFLKDLHRQFGDWSLALAAYNCGPGRVRRAMESSGATTFWELLEQSAVPKETRGYVPTFYATLLIASDPATYGFTLGRPEDLDHQDVEVEGPVSLAYVAQVADVSEAKLRELNPGLRRGIVPPGRASLRVPSKAVKLVAAQARTMRNDDSEIALTSFTLREGDTIKKLAQAIGVKPETLREMNGLRAAANVGGGSSLYLPVRATQLGTLLRESENRSFYYAVKKGDTLYSVAKRHDLSVEELADLNSITKKTKLRPGQKLRIASRTTLTAGGGM